MDNILEIYTYIIRIPIVLLSLTVHEVSHGYAAYKLGDPTARNLGRLSLNPIKHLDPLGALCMLFFRFGWANRFRSTPGISKSRGATWRFPHWQAPYPIS